MNQPNSTEDLSSSLVIYLSEHCLATKTSLTFTEGVSFSEWAEVGVRLRDIEKSIHWWIGDWLNFGEARWGEMYTQVLDATNFEYGTLRNDKWVAGRFELSSRDDNISFTHHRMVADVEDLPQRQELLAQAIDQHWTAGQLLEEKKRRLSPEAPPRLIHVRATVRQVEGVPDDGEVDVTFTLPRGYITQVTWLLEQLGLEVDAVITKTEGSYV